jgi:hypothetical protein
VWGSLGVRFGGVLASLARPSCRLDAVPTTEEWR